MKYRGLSAYLVFQTTGCAVLVGFATGSVAAGAAVISLLLVVDAFLDRLT